MNDISSISGAQVKDIGYKVASEIRLLRSRTSELELELQKAEEKVLHLTTELTETRRLANETKEDLEESKIRYNSLLATVADLQAKFREATRLYEEENKALASKANKLSEYLSKAEKHESSFDRTVKDLRHQINSEKENNTRLSLRLEEAERMLQECRKEKEYLRVENTDLKQQLLLYEELERNRSNQLQELRYREMALKAEMSSCCEEEKSVLRLRVEHLEKKKILQEKTEKQLLSKIEYLETELKRTLEAFHDEARSMEPVNIVPDDSNILMRTMKSNRTLSNECKQLKKDLEQCREHAGKLEQCIVDLKAHNKELQDAVLVYDTMFDECNLLPQHP